MHLIIGPVYVAFPNSSTSSLYVSMLMLRRSYVSHPTPAEPYQRLSFRSESAP